MLAPTLDLTYRMGTVIPLRRRTPTKRQHERVALCQPVALVDAFGTVATASTADLSPGGMQVACDRYTMDSLHLSDQRRDPSNAVRIDVHFQLPLTSGLVKLDVECRLVYVVADEDTGEFLMGLQFVRFHYAGAHVVERFLREASLLENH